MTESSDVDIALVYPDAKSLKIGRAAIYRQAPPDAWPLDLLFATEESFHVGREKGGLFALVMGEGRVIHGSLEWGLDEAEEALDLGRIVIGWARDVVGNPAKE